MATVWAIVLSAVAILAPAAILIELFVTIPFGTEIAVVSRVLIVLVMTSVLLEERGRRQMLVLAFIAVVSVAAVPLRLEGESSVLANALGVAAVVVFFAVPFPALVYVAHSRQDEMQRSLATLAAGIAFLVTMAGSAGYWIVQQIVPVPQTEVPWVLIFGGVTWLGAWGILRLRMLR